MSTFSAAVVLVGSLSWAEPKPTGDDDAEHHYFHRRERPHAAQWGYSGANGPAHWGDLSPQYRLAKVGESQSPVDLRGVLKKDLPELRFEYRPSRIHLLYNGHTVQENEDPGSFTLAGKARYELKQFHFHSPSEHTINGSHYPMEMHLVHRSEDGQIGVVAVFITQGGHNHAFDPVWDNLPGPGATRKDSMTTVDVGKLLPAARTYYRYDGSLTTPPCTEHVHWVVLASPVSLSKQQIARFRAVINNNNRPVQPLNNRPVFVSK